jgi:transcriptional regulator with XRE-family HTH domain
MKHEECSNCGTMAPVIRTNHRFDEMGLPVELMRVKVVKCPQCGNTDPIIPDLNDLMHAMALAVVCRTCKLSGAEFRFLRKYIGKSGEEFGRLLHLDKTTVSKMENDIIPIGDQTDRLVRFVVLNSSAELANKAKRLLVLLPDIEDCLDTKPGIQINPDTMEIQYV